MKMFYCGQKYNCPSNQTFEKLAGPLGEIVSVSAHKYCVIMPHRNMMLMIRHRLIREMRYQDVGYFIANFKYLASNVM